MLAYIKFLPVKMKFEGNNMSNLLRKIKESKPKQFKKRKHFIECIFETYKDALDRLPIEKSIFGGEDDE